MKISSNSIQNIYIKFFKCINSSFLSAIQYLYERGVKVHAIMVIAAAQVKRYNILSYLIDHALLEDLQIRYGGIPMISLACEWHDPEYIKKLIKLGIDVNAKDNQNHSCLYYLERDFSSTTIQIMDLLVANGFDMEIIQGNPNDQKSNTVLGDFVSDNKTTLKIIEWLLAHGANPNALIYPQNITILEYVKNYKNNDLIDLFDKYSTPKS